MRGGATKARQRQGPLPTAAAEAAGGGAEDMQAEAGEGGDGDEEMLLWPTLEAVAAGNEANQGGGWVACCLIECGAGTAGGGWVARSFMLCSSRFAQPLQLRSGWLPLLLWRRLLSCGTLPVADLWLLLTLPLLPQGVQHAV